MPQVPQRVMYLGIDPGMNGGLASIGGSGSTRSEKMPDTERDIWQWFNIFGSQHQMGHVACFAIIEKVHAMPGNGVSGMFKFGASYGGLRMALVAAAIPFEEVQPRTWQKALGVVPKDKKGGESYTDFKNRLKAIAQQLYPDLKITLANADALLIATYCQRKREGTL